MTDAPIEFDLDPANPTVIKVVGVGGAGGNALRRMIRSGMQGVDFIAINTDVQHLQTVPAQARLAIGKQTTRGLGSGADPAKAKAAAEEDLETIREQLAGADMVFLAAGLGKGTGTGATPVIAKAARDLGALVVAIVTYPFDHEKVARNKADAGLAELRPHVDSLITVYNQRLLRMAGPKTRSQDAYQLADSVLQAGVQGISDIITRTGDHNVDFADVRTILADQGDALMAMAEAEGENRIEEVVARVASNPLLSARSDDEAFSIAGARKLLVNITHGPDDFLFHDEVELQTRISDLVDRDAVIVNGLFEDAALAGKIRVTVVAAGFRPSHLAISSVDASAAAAPTPAQAKAEEAPLAPAAPTTREDDFTLHESFASAPVKVLDPDVETYILTESSLHPQTAPGRPVKTPGADEYEIPAYLRRRG